MVGALLLLAAAQHPQPQLHALFPPGAKAGTTVEVKLSAGADLDELHRLVFSHPGITAEPVMLPASRYYPEPRREGRRFKVTVAADVPVGLYEARVFGALGGSNARRFAVGDRDEIVETEPNNEPEKATELAVDAVVSGILDSENMDCFRFEGKKGVRLVVAVRAQEIDSRAIPVVTLQDAAGRQLARAAASRGSDPVLDHTPAADGPLTVRLHDLTYRGGDLYGYRLVLTTGPWIEYAEPPVIRAGVESAVTLVGRNLPGERLEVKITAPADPGALAAPGDLVMRAVESSVDTIAWRLSPRSNAVRLAVAEEATAAEAEPNDAPAQAQSLMLPAAVAGRFQSRGDRDGYVFDAKKGQSLWIEIVSQRLGLPTDPHLLLQQVLTDDKGVVTYKDLQEVDDQPTPMQSLEGNRERRYRMGPEDPGLLFSVPEDGRYRLVVRDQFDSGQGDPRLGYWLVVRPARPDFRLVAEAGETFAEGNKLKTWALVLRRGGSARLRVMAYRREGLDAPIRIEAAGLPPGVTARPATMNGQQTWVDLILQAAPDAPAWIGAIAVTGRAVDRVRPARCTEVVWAVSDDNDQWMTRLASGVTIAVDEHAVAPLTLAPVEEKVHRMSRGGKLSFPIVLVKNADFKDIEKVQVKVNASGIPNPKNQPAMTAKEVTVQLDKPGVLELELTDKAPVGLFSFIPRGEVEMPYTHNPGGRIGRLEEDKKRIDETLKQVAEEIKQAGERRKQAEEQAKTAAAEAKAAGEALEKAKAAANAEETAKAEQAVKDVAAKATAAEEARKKATDEEAAGKALTAEGEEAKKKNGEAIKAATDSSKEKKIKVLVAAPPVTVDVVGYPIALTLKPAAATAGQTVEVAVEIVRDFGFADEVKLELKAPDGLKVKAEAASVAKDQNAAVLKIAVDKAVAAGTHAVTVRAAMTFNGKALTLDVPLELAVAAAASN